MAAHNGPQDGCHCGEQSVFVLSSWESVLTLKWSEDNIMQYNNAFNQSLFHIKILNAPTV